MLRVRKSIGKERDCCVVDFFSGLISRFYKGNLMDCGVQIDIAVGWLGEVGGLILKKEWVKEITLKYFSHSPTPLGLIVLGSRLDPWPGRS